MNQIILAVDGGATKTTLTIRTTDGQELFAATSTGSNYQAIGRNHVQQVFEQLLAQASTAIAERDLVVAVFAIAGIDTKEDARIVREIVVASMENSIFTAQKLIIENDVEATLLGLANGQPATLLISGTGAICFSYTGVKIVRAGGWGHRAGDEGSGYWLGQQVAKAIFRAADGRDEPTLLTDMVLRDQQLADVDALMNWLYHADYTNAQLASLGAYVQQAIVQGDHIAVRIAHEAAQELTLLATTTLKNAGYHTGAHTFYVNGGVLKHNPIIYEKFVESVHDVFPEVQFELCKEKPIEYIVKRAYHTACIATDE
ncbi:BadF/BadG/BcrA/BcrD ATPase family protein [Lysinibacillus sp. KU-BSD001]|uniref:N-acetylglucosamine kinase n=1 Tax=Lysinibacillus sp. KU-BSD001 TaxID=3141328 RepID=UPI0036E0A769